MTSGIGEINGVRVHITRHALSRMVELKLDREFLEPCLLTPERTYVSPKYPGSILHTYGDFALAMFPRDGMLVIVTVLPATQAAWLKANRDGLLGADRILRDCKHLPRF